MTTVEDRPALTLAIIEDLKRKGLSQSDIARAFGVTRQAVSFHVRKYGGTLTPRQKALEHFPFVVKGDVLQKHTVCQRLRDHAEYFVTGGEDMSFDKYRHLPGFYRKLQGLVVEFTPDEGFVFTERLDSDEGLMIRVNEHAHVSEFGRKMWMAPTNWEGLVSKSFDSKGLIPEV